MKNVIRDDRGILICEIQDSLANFIILNSDGYFDNYYENKKLVGKKFVITTDMVFNVAEHLRLFLWKDYKIIFKTQ